MNNKEWLDNLATTDPHALQAWFDSPHAQVDDGAACVTKTPEMSNVVDVDNSEIAELRDELANRDKGIERLKKRRDELQETCNLLAVESDDLEADRDDWRGKCEEATAKVDKLTIELENAHAKNRQLKAHIANMQDGRHGWHLQAEKLQAQVDNLARDLAESERLREEMREELGVAYDYATDFLARRDRGLA